ncbi:MAG TPA: spore germination protein, partial [Bacillota bacterium]|nr:spore germination protein [Bacillota bacterium]
MFSFFVRKFQFMKQLLQEQAKSSSSPSDQADGDLNSSLERNLEEIKQQLNSSTDLILRRFTIKVPEDEQAALVFIDGLTDKTIINEHMLRPLML